MEGYAGKVLIQGLQNGRHRKKAAAFLKWTAPKTGLAADFEKKIWFEKICIFRIIAQF